MTIGELIEKLENFDPEQNVCITLDKDAVSALLDAVLAQYAGLEVQEAAVPAIKNEMAGLNRLRERMDNARKDIKRRIAGPLDGFDAEVKVFTEHRHRPLSG